MTRIPHEKSLDSSLALLSEGYAFISNRCQRFESDLFETRLMLRKAICMRGAEAAKFFYDADRFTRQKALPPTTLRLLLDLGSVELLDDEAHRWRKQMFMSLMTPENIDRLVDLMADQWHDDVGKWDRMRRVVLHDAAQEILCRAVCAWAGVPLPASEVRARTGQFAAMIDGAGAVGPRVASGLLLRMGTERWIQGIIARIRAGRLEVPEGSAAHVISWHRDLDGKLLDIEVATVELINILRPTVAVARFVTFVALALHDHPDWRERLQAGDDADVELFVQEVRRFYPFFPLIGGRARDAFDWRGHHFAKGTWVLLDLYGTNHDPEVWEQPHEFRPDRFRDWDGSAFNFIPQGGGDFFHDHRCAGEWVTIALMKRAVRLLTACMDYEVPEQNLTIDLSRMPAIPASRFVISNVRWTG